MNRVPFDTDALREWADYQPATEPTGHLLVKHTVWQQMRADLLAAADEIEMLMIERTKEAA